MTAAVEQDYRAFLEHKAQIGENSGFEPLWIPEFLFDFQKSLVEWSVRKGRAAIFADCGLGKTPIQLVWAENVVRHTNGRVLILTPLAVSAQTVREAEKFDIECSRDTKARIAVTNYERLHYFDPSDFVGVVCDESSILKNFDGVRRNEITQFMRKMQYRLLCTATAAPNDYVELGTSSEALGYLGHMDMLARFFKNEQNSIKPRVYMNKGADFSKAREAAKWRFKGHAEEPFWKWVCSWARAVRRPSDLGFPDGDFVLPQLTEVEHVVSANRLAEGQLFALPAFGMREQREERRRTMAERCEKVARLVGTKEPALVWCHMNDEGDLLESLISDCVQVSGADTDDAKEEKFMAFIDGKARVCVVKPKIAAWGLNLQHCAHETFFPSHSYEQYYQGIRRCYRFGQKRPVRIDIVTTEGERGVAENLKRKAVAADKMFARLVDHMRDSISIARSTPFTKGEVIPQWL